MKCVNDTLPPRPRRRWLLTTVRLSTSSLAGIARTLVAVGTARLDSMLATTRAAAPLSGRASDPPGTPGAAGSREAVGAAGAAGVAGAVGTAGAAGVAAGGAGRGAGSAGAAGGAAA